MKANVRMETPQKLGFLVCFVIAVYPLVSRTLTQRHSVNIFSNVPTTVIVAITYSTLSISQVEYQALYIHYPSNNHGTWNFTFYM